MDDIQNRADLEKILAAFYEKLLHDNSINYVFTDVAKIDIKTHLPVITDFWEQTLFHAGGYRNNVLQIHRDLHAKVKLTDFLLTVWLTHLNETIDTHFSGENAEKMKTRALSISTMMRIKLSQNNY